MTYNVFLIPAALFGLAVFIYQLDCYSKGAKFSVLEFGCILGNFTSVEVEVKNDFNKYDNQIIIAVHLFGSSCDIEKIQILSKNFNCIFAELSQM